MNKKSKQGKRHKQKEPAKESSENSAYVDALLNRRKNGSEIEH